MISLISNYSLLLSNFRHRITARNKTSSLISEYVVSFFESLFCGLCLLFDDDSMSKHDDHLQSWQKLMTLLILDEPLAPLLLFWDFAQNTESDTIHCPDDKPRIQDTSVTLHLTWKFASQVLSVFEPYLTRIAQYLKGLFSFMWFLFIPSSGWWSFWSS